MAGICNLKTLGVILIAFGLFFLFIELLVTGLYSEFKLMLYDKLFYFSIAAIVIGAIFYIAGRKCFGARKAKDKNQEEIQAFQDYFTKLNAGSNDLIKALHHPDPTNKQLIVMYQK